METPCPICSKAVPLTGPDRPPTAPFCSQRCRLVDLGAWMSEDHVVEGGVQLESWPSQDPD